MKRRGLIVTAVCFGVFVVFGQQANLFGSSNPDSFPKLPDSPNFNVSVTHDGTWLGRRVDVTGNNLCERTTISGKIENGFATFTLTYNGTPLRGWVEQQTGELILFASNRQWDYRFKGIAGRERINGDWFLTNGPCKGHWYLEKQTSG